MDATITRKPSAYNQTFFAAIADESYRSAAIILDIVSSYLDVTSVVDVGCGTGTWLKVWRERGVEEMLGIDGDYVDKSQLRIGPDKFLAMDLADPIPVGRRFDLAQSLEVAEHLPENKARKFVDLLTSLSDVILFSAAIPYQGGTCHMNEQWPEYWARLFEGNGYRFIDAIRPHVWGDPNVCYYYAQNTFIAMRSPLVDRHPTLGPIARATGPNALSRVHPRKWMESQERVVPFEKLVWMAPVSLSKLPGRALHKIRRLLAP
jgi:SAM-dependent methyltransferase